MTVALPIPAVHTGRLAGTRTLNEADLFALEDALTDAAGTGDIVPFDPQQVLLPQLRELAPTVQSIAVLAPSQRDLFIHYSRDPAAPTYVLGFSMALLPDVDPEKWTRALREAERAAPTFCSRYFEFAEAFFQVLDDAVVSSIEIVHLDRDDPNAAAKVTQAALDRPFDLFDGASRHLLLIGKDCASALLVCHHIAVDAVSAALFFHHVLAAYAGTVVPEDQRFLDWAATAADTPQQIPASWQAALHGVQPLLPVATDSSEHMEQARLEPALLKLLMNWCRQHQLPLAGVLKCLAAVLLAREVDADQDYLLHDVIAARTTGQSTLIGCLYRILPIRCATAELRAGELTAITANFQRRVNDALALPAVSMLALSNLLRPSGAPVYLNFFDHTGIAPLLRSAHAPAPPQFVFHDRIGAGETHIVYERDASGLRISVRSRHPALAERNLAKSLVAAVTQIGNGAAGIAQLWPDDAQFATGLAQTHVPSCAAEIAP